MKSSALELSASHRPFPSNFVSPHTAFQTMLATCPGASSAPLHTCFPPAAILVSVCPGPAALCLAKLRKAYENLYHPRADSESRSP